MTFSDKISRVMDDVFDDPNAGYGLVLAVMLFCAAAIFFFGLVGLLAPVAALVLWLVGRFSVVMCESVWRHFFKNNS